MISENFDEIDIFWPPDPLGGPVNGSFGPEMIMSYILIGSDFGHQNDVFGCSRPEKRKCQKEMTLEQVLKQILRILGKSIFFDLQTPLERVLEGPFGPKMTIFGEKSNFENRFSRNFQIRIPSNSLNGPQFVQFRQNFNKKRGSSS